jgi:hypothetical protein
LPHPAACARRFSQPLDAFRSTASLPALFHAGSAHGVAPFRALLPPRGRTPSPTPIPSWCWSPLVTISTSRSRSHPRRPKPPRARATGVFLSEPKPRQAETVAARPAGTEVPPRRTVARPSERRSALRAEPWLHSPRPRSLRAERSPDPPMPKHRRAEPRPPSESPKAPFGSSGRFAFRDRSPFLRSARPNSHVRDPEGSRLVRAERPLDPREPKLRRMRRAALPARIRRFAWLGHRSALRGSEDPRRPDRSPARPAPEGPVRIERFHSLPVEAEAPPEIRRPQPSTTGAEAPLAPDERSVPPRSEDPVGSVRPASHAAVRRPRRSRRAPHPGPPSTEATVARDDPLGAAAIRRPRRLRSGCPSFGRPKTTSGPSRIRRSARASATSEDAVEVGQGVPPLRRPKTPSVRDPAGPLPRPEGRFGDPTGALLSAAEAASIRAPPFAPQKAVTEVSPRFPFRDRSPFRSGAALPKPVAPSVPRFPFGDRSPFRSGAALPKPQPLSDRTSGRDGPESFLTFRGLIPAAIRHSRAGCLGRRAARSSPGLFALQGVHPLCGRLGSHRAFPSWTLLHRAQATGELALQGFTRSEVGSSLSRPPTLLGFVASRLSRTFESVAIRESPPQVPGCVTVP